MGRINKDWHAAHPMPKNATEAQRLDWHLAHAANCGCRAIPGTIRKVMEARSIAMPERAETQATTGD